MQGAGSTALVPFSLLALKPSWMCPRCPTGLFSLSGGSRGLGILTVSGWTAEGQRAPC